MAELKTRKYSKEQLVSYLEKHGSNLTEAANIAGTNPRTLGRYLAQGVIPSEWLAKIQAALKDTKPAAKTIKAEVKACSACGKKLMLSGKEVTEYNCSSDNLQALGVKDIPAGGWHWWENPKTHERKRMYPICDKCWKKLEELKKSSKKTVKGKIATKSK